MHFFSEALLFEFRQMATALASRAESLEGGCFYATYDTTYNCGSFLVSILTVSNAMFCTRTNTTTPLIPVIYMVHEKRTVDVHKAFWRLVLDAFPELLELRIPIISDREASIVKAMREESGGRLNQCLCWNHLRRDAKQWVKDNSVSVPRIGGDIDDLLECESEEAITELVKVKKSEWDPAFNVYFSKK
jgi:hypothetical protein